MTKPGFKNRAPLATEKYGDDEPDWESGTYETFVTEFLQRAKDENLPAIYDQKFITELMDDIEAVHTWEQGMNMQFRDLAYQYWMSIFLTVTMKRSHEVLTDSNNIPNHESLQIHLDNLKQILSENIALTQSRSNVTPTFDLGLNSNQELLITAVGLKQSIDSFLPVLISNDASNSSKSILEEGLREFVIKLMGSFGEGLGKALSWGACIGVAYVSISALGAMGINVTNLWQKLQSFKP